MNQNLVISERDETRLRRLLGGLSSPTPAQRDSLSQLASELNRARIVPENEIPPDIVTLGSTVELEDLDDGEVLTYTLVLPGEADASLGRISVLAPLGTAMLGDRAGSEFRWPVPGGTLHARIRRVGQKESTNPTPDRAP